MSNPFSPDNLDPILSNYPVQKGGSGSGRYPKGTHQTINGRNVTIAPGADLYRGNLTGADLTNADLTGAYLTGANLVRANLTGADLTNADLRSANLYRAVLGDAKLNGANLKGADLTNADLTNADLRGADLTVATLNRANLNGAKADEYTKLPDTHEVINGFVVERNFEKARIVKGGSGSGRYPAGSGMTARSWSALGNSISKLHDLSHALAGRAKGLSTYAHAIGSRPMEEMEDKHLDISSKHSVIAEKLLDLVYSLSGRKLPNTHPVLDALRKAMNAHQDASRAHILAEPLRASQDEAIKLSAKAAQLTDKALSMHYNSTAHDTGTPIL